ncbi:MAG: hypothetical protein FWG70_09830 [Oscillospiraceae bacterium]|nr:hypothetical protein [Oscillospiraceae bacterium]
MNNYVLFSPVGMTDPIRDGHDGPLLHIVRYFKPSKVYIFLTAEMEKIDSLTDCYSKAVKYLSPDCEVEKLRSGIEDPSDFDAFHLLFGEKITRINNENPGAEILLNVSSGTPQIISALCLEAITHNADNLTPIQVRTHTKVANAEIKHFDPKKDDVINEMENYLFDADIKADNRCHKPDLLAFKRSMIKNQLKALVLSFEYKGAYELANKNTRLIKNERLELLLLHAYRRSLPDVAGAEKAARELKMYNKLYPVQNNAAKKVCEYFLAAKLRAYRGELTDFILRTSALTEHLLREDIAKKVGGLDKIASKNRKGVWNLDEYKSEEKIPGLREHLNKEFRSEFNYERTGITAWEIIAEYIELTGYESLLKIKNNRNYAAHDLDSITESDLERLGIKKPEALLNDFEVLIKRIYGEHIKPSVFNIFETLNKWVINELDFA